MGKTNTLSIMTSLYVLFLILCSVAYAPALACPSDSGECRTCIMDRFKIDCPPCAPILRCMARCLWGGTSRAKCTTKCDCGDNKYPRLSDCKKCISKCKCSCTSA